MTPPRPPPVPAAVDWLFRDRTTGRLVVGQFPNAPLIVFLVARVGELVFDPQGTVGDVVHLVGTAALVWWAVDELVRGVNPWRRMLGAAALAFALVGLLTG